MATIKSYTSFEQSKKLAEFLPIESADMFWQSNLNSSDRQYLLDTGKEEHFNIEMNFEHYEIGDYDIPAWSLTALLNVLPDFHLKKYKYNDGTTVYYTSSLECGQFNSRYYNNPVDACYELILKIHKLKML